MIIAANAVLLVARKNASKIRIFGLSSLVLPKTAF